MKTPEHVVPRILVERCLAVAEGWAGPATTAEVKAELRNVLASPLVGAEPLEVAS